MRLDNFSVECKHDCTAVFRHVYTCTFIWTCLQVYMDKCSERFVTSPHSRERKPWFQVHPEMQHWGIFIWRSYRCSWSFGRDVTPPRTRSQTPLCEHSPFVPRRDKLAKLYHSKYTNQPKKCTRKARLPGRAWERQQLLIWPGIEDLPRSTLYAPPMIYDVIVLGKDCSRVSVFPLALISSIVKIIERAIFTDITYT